MGLDNFNWKQMVQRLNAGFLELNLLDTGLSQLIKQA